MHWWECRRRHEELLRSPDRPDPEIDRIWIDEAERRLEAYRAGRVKGIAAEDVVAGGGPRSLLEAEQPVRAATAAGADRA